MSKQNKSEKRGVGRHSFKVAIPSGRFTFLKLCIHNGAVKPDGTPFKDGEEGQRCVPLTLRNWLARDHKKGSKSEVVRLRDELGKPDSESGKGRKPFVFLRRSQKEAGEKGKANLIKAKQAPVTVDVADISAPAPTPEPVTTAPEMTAPVVATPEPVTVS